MRQSLLSLCVCTVTNLQAKPAAHGSLVVIAKGSTEILGGDKITEAYST